MFWKAIFRFFEPSTGVGRTFPRVCCAGRVYGGFPKLGVQNWGPHNKDYSILGSILGSPYLGKLPYHAIFLPVLYVALPVCRVYGVLGHRNKGPFAPAGESHNGNILLAGRCLGLGCMARLHLRHGVMLWERNMPPELSELLCAPVGSAVPQIKPH